MLFNSFGFLGFFAAIVVLYYVIPHRFRWVLLLAGSLYFYSIFQVSYVLLLLGLTLVVYVLGLLLGRPGGEGQAGLPARQAGKKALLVVGVVVSLAPLVIFKYFDFFMGSLESLLLNMRPESQAGLLPRLEWLLPAGLSFYTFSCVSYLVDVYKGLLPAQRHVGHLALYVAFFPRLLAGPIERAKPFLTQLLEPVAFNYEGVALGLQMILWGLFKKVVIADRLAVFVNSVYDLPGFASPLRLIIATYFYAFQIYCDFSGYSDIAIGAAKVLGIDLMENFRRPYFSTSPVEFWSRDRWHISLNKWFRDYMYFPMGGSRVSKPRYYFNQMAVFLVSGLWHGANWTFVIWGGLNGIYQVLTLMTAGIRTRVGQALRLPSWVGAWLGRLLTFHLILVSWVFFRALTVSDAFTVFRRVIAAIPQLRTQLAAFPFTGEILLSLGLIGFLLVVEAFDEWGAFWVKLRAWPRLVRWPVYLLLLLALLVIGKWGMEQFVYMQF